MSIKNKESQNNFDKLTDLGRQAGMVLMAAAVTIGMLEMPDHGNTRVVAPSQPNLAFAPNINDNQSNNPLRRESEETAPHYISYSEVQRTPSRSGRS